MSETRRQYDPEFRAGAVRIVVETRRPVAEVARELGICEGTLGNWVRRDRAERFGERLVGAILADLHDEWQATDRRYLSEDSISLLYPQRDSLATAELTVGDHHRGSTQKPTT